MLGNFSFGQYFKQGAIEYATEFIQKRLELPWDRIWATVHAGDPQLRLGEDEVAIELWQQVGLPRERIVPLPSSENFWSVGGPGPCGPDSEIYFDWGEEFGCGERDCAPACPRCDRFLEFWNLVFMAYEQHPDGTLTALPKQNVDTGMTFLVGDGVLPSNEGRGYVLRRIIRRAVQQARAIGLADLWRLTDVVVEQMRPWYPELPEGRERIQEIVRTEEERFSETLARGLRLFEDVAAKGEITGEDAFTLAATYGFPVELTRELARERGLHVDEEDFTRRMAEHREISRAGEARGAGDIGGPQTEFVGYEKT